MKEKTYAQEIIGKTIKVVDSKNKDNIGIEGKITDETKSTIVVRKKRLFKKNITIILNNKKVKGTRLLKRSEERIK